MLAAHLDGDRDPAVLVAQHAAPGARPADRWRRRRKRQRPAQAGQRGEVWRRQLPELAQLLDSVEQPRDPWHAPRRELVNVAGAARHEARSIGARTERARDRAGAAAVGGEHAGLRPEERGGRLAQTLGLVATWASEQRFDERAGGSHHYLNRRRGPRGGHRAQQRVAAGELRRRGREARTGSCSQRGAPVQRHEHGRRVELAFERAQAQVRVADTQSGLDVTRHDGRRTDREPGDRHAPAATVEVHFEGEDAVHAAEVTASRAGKQRVQ